MSGVRRRKKRRAAPSAASSELHAGVLGSAEFEVVGEEDRVRHGSLEFCPCPLSQSDSQLLDYRLPRRKSSTSMKSKSCSLPLWGWFLAVPLGGVGRWLRAPSDQVLPRPPAPAPRLLFSAARRLQPLTPTCPGRLYHRLFGRVGLELTAAVPALRSRLDCHWTGALVCPNLPR